jgi:hypothetical protein
MSALKDAVDTNEAIDGLVGASKAVAPPPELTNDELEEDLAFLRAASTNIKDDDKERPSKKSKGQEFLKAPPANTRTRVGADFQVDLSILNDKDDDDDGDEQEQR